MDPPIRWRRPACAPGLKFASQQADVVIRYRYAGRIREVRVPVALWAPFVHDVRAGVFDRLTAHDGALGWTSWGAGSGQVARSLPDEMIVRFLHSGTMRENRLPQTIWDQILVAVRAHAIDDLDAGVDEASAERRPTGFRTVHGSALPLARQREGGAERFHNTQPRPHHSHPAR
ncbi:hypothetical protein [Frankia gtarii]|uniref:hypothetical protein n=2 Tax=Frankia gtarii TaxID=2950102 RepID=UPI0021BFB306|nr:hypothetical protein [Frankia gtarii]